MTDVLLQQLPDDTFLARLDSLMDRSVLAGMERADLRLRVLADHFLSRADFPPPDLVAMEATLLSSLAGASQEAVDTIAARLVEHPQASGTLFSALVARGGAAGRAALRGGRDLDTAILGEIATLGDMGAATAVAGRADLSTDIATILFRRPERDVLVTLLRNPACHLDRTTASWLVTRARHDDELAKALLARGPVACDLTSLFLAADAETRAKIIGEARRRDVGSLPIPRRVAPPTFVDALETALVDRDRAAAIDALARDQRISRQDVARMLDDATGEACALLLNVAGVAPPLAGRVLPWIVAHPLNSGALASLERLACELPPQTARRIVAAITGRPVATNDAAKRGVPVANTSTDIASRNASRPALQRRVR